MEKLIADCFERARILIDSTDDRLKNAALLYMEYCAEKNYIPASRYFEEQRITVVNRFQGACGLLLEAESGNAVAQFLVGNMYYSGDKIPTDYLEAERWLVMSADKGLSDAEFSLGCINFYGRGKDKDYIKAFEFFSKSAEKNNASAFNNLAVCYQAGLGVPKNVNKAIKFYKKAAELGHDKAKRSVAEIYYESNRAGHLVGFIMMLISVVIVVSTQLLTYEYRGAVGAPRTLWAVVVLSMVSGLFGLYWGRRLYAGRRGRANLIAGALLLLLATALSVLSFNTILTVIYAATAVLYFAFCVWQFFALKIPRLIKDKFQRAKN
jgi:hypothetical protein